MKVFYDIIFATIIINKTKIQYYNYKGFYDMVIAKTVNTLIVQLLKNVNILKGMVEMANLMKGGGGLPSFLVKILQFFSCTPN